MSNLAAIFEIPATDLTRAVAFYSAILDVSIEVMEMEDIKLGLFPYDEQSTVGVIMQGEGCVPSSSGVTLYLNAGDDLQQVLSRVEPNGGKIVLSKTPHADESGFFALFLDSEGNRLGLHSPN
ncbi:glyoxalase [Bacterioplanes sanyensis]|uniref:VOC family protein n=1 Tax=Bacterioplanes sanyensis TaxID=1249553 RepID=UPI001673EEF8|nr:VOC family protein [Bacterioplanes sanyensis]GGY56832.1 glyoxalase [Bacterioplanes sanyensis]